MAGDKVNKTEKIRRTTEMMGMLLDGLTRQEIFQYTSEKWGVTSRQTRHYIKWAENRIARFDDSRMMSKIRARYERQYRRALQKDKQELARLILKDMKDIYGIDAPQKHALTDSKGNDVETKTEINFISGEISKLSPKVRDIIYKALEETGKNGNGGR